MEGQAHNGKPGPLTTPWSLTPLALSLVLYVIDILTCSSYPERQEQVKFPSVVLLHVPPFLHNGSDLWTEQGLYNSQSKP